MKRKIIQAVAVISAGLALLWCGMFCTDAYRSGHLMKPVFARPASSGTSVGFYEGLGYTVEVKADENGTRIYQVTMYVSDMVISASVT